MTMARLGARLRRRAGERRGAALRAAGDGGVQVLAVQARAGARGRGARVPRRQRLRRGVDDAAALSRSAAQRHLGRLGQRHLPRRAARDAARIRRRCSCSSTSACGARRAAHRARRRRVRARARRHVEDIEARARRVVERMALTLQASLLVRHAPAALASAFLASRLDGDRGLAFGTLPRGIAVDAIPRAGGGCAIGVGVAARGLGARRRAGAGPRRRAGARCSAARGSCHCGALLQPPQRHPRAVEHLARGAGAERGGG